MVRRLATTPQLLTTYGTIIAEQEAHGFIERVDNAQLSDNVYYIPHHPVRKDSATTPIRIVYDCGFYSSFDNSSLNDCLHASPPFLNAMFDSSAVPHLHLWLVNRHRKGVPPYWP